MKRIIKSSQYWIREKYIEDVEEFKELFTFIPKYKELQPVPTYTVADLPTNGGEVERHYGCPRHSRIDTDGYEIEDRTTKGGNNGEMEVPFIGDMWDYQEPIILDFVDRLKKGHTDLILSASPGSGKTVMMLKMWSILGVPALVIVPKSDLMNQWKDRIKQFTGLEDSDIGIARQDVCEYENKKIVVGMIHSLCKDKYPEDFKKYFGLVLFDELHKLGAFTFSQVGGMFPARYRLGATATLRRGDGMDKVFYSHLGKEVIRPLKGDRPIPKIVVVKYSKSSGKIPHWANSKVKRRGVLFSMLASNPERVDWIAKLANDVYSTGRQTLVLGERIALLESIIKFLTFKYKVNKEDIGLYIGKTSATERKRVAETCKIIMATTSMLSLGTDIPTLRGLIFATPLADVEQAIGRICRMCPDTSYPVVIDFVDTFYKDAFGWSQGRLKLYKKEGWEILYT